MIYQRYFKSGQRLLLKVLSGEETPYTEFLTAYLDYADGNTYTLSLPYSDDASEQYPFCKGMAFELNADALGLGIAVTGTFIKRVDGKRIQLSINADLQMFQRRETPRIDCRLGIRFVRGKQGLKFLRDTWEKNIQVLHSPKAPLKLEGFNPCQVNISRGGIRFAVRPPAEPVDLCLMLIDLDDGLQPICAVAETIWTKQENIDAVVICGMRFINILLDDQLRIDRFVAQRRR